MYRVLHPAIDITTPQTVDGSQGSLRIKISEERSARRLCREVGDYCGDHRPPNPEAPQAPLIFATACLPRTYSSALQPEWRSGARHTGECYVSEGQTSTRPAMRAVAIILAVSATVACGAARAQTTTPNVVTPIPGLQTPLTFTTTTCMMTCNSRAANCQTGCFVPPPPVNAPGPAPNLNPAAGHVSKLGLPHGLHVNSTCLPERMCAELAFSLACPSVQQG
jgi:hypothetical protein